MLAQDFLNALVLGFRGISCEATLKAEKMSGASSQSASLSGKASLDASTKEKEELCAVSAVLEEMAHHLRNTANRFKI